MVNKNLLIVFVKNIILGKVKTRLAKTIGNDKAFFVYKELVKITEDATQEIKNCDIHIYFSDVVIKTKWLGFEKFVQEGENLGVKMQNAINNGFEYGYKKVLLIGSDLPDISSSIIQEGFKSLQKNDIVFGPAEDGGYYLVGMKKMHSIIFENKPWSTKELLNITLNELSDKKIHLLKTLNDIDEYKDLINYPSLLKLVDKI